MRKVLAGLTLAAMPGVFFLGVARVGAQQSTIDVEGFTRKTVEE